MRKVFFIASVLGMMHSYGQQSLTSTSKPEAESTANDIYRISDRMATFPGGPSGWDKYLKKNVDYSIPIRNHAPPGRYTVLVTFIIDEKGVVNELKPLTSYGYGMEEEMLRIIAKGPRWIPAMHKGKIVKSYRKQPLTFIVSNKSK